MLVKLHRVWLGVKVGLEPTVDIEVVGVAQTSSGRAFFEVAELKSKLQPLYLPGL